MIEINLLPEELRIKKRNEVIDPRYFLYVIPVVFALLIIAHVLFSAALFEKKFEVSSFERQWKALEPERKSLEAVKKESDAMLQDFLTVQGFFSKRVTWSDKLNKLSLDLPSGVWFSDISVTSKELTVKGSVVSLQKEEMALINTFLDKLKSDRSFAASFEDLELVSVQRRNVASYEIVDFIISGKLKPH